MLSAISQVIGSVKTREIPPLSKKACMTFHSLQCTTDYFACNISQISMASFICLLKN